MGSVALRRVSVRRQMWIELGLLALISLGSWGFRLYLRTDEPFSPWANTLPVFADWFAFGMALAILSVVLQSRPGRPLPRAVRVIGRWPVLPWAAAVIVYLVASELVTGPHAIELFGRQTLYWSPREDLAIHILFAFVGAGLLIPAIFGTQGGGTVRRILADGRLAWLGLVSYGIYLWQGSVLQVICQPQGDGFINDSCRLHNVSVLQHVPFLSLTVIAIPIVVVCAAASYYAVERPLLRLKYRRTPPAAPPPPASRPPARAVATAER